MQFLPQSSLPFLPRQTHLSLVKKSFFCFCSPRPLELFLLALVCDMRWQLSVAMAFQVKWKLQLLNSGDLFSPSPSSKIYMLCF